MKVSTALSSGDFWLVMTFFFDSRRGQKLQVKVRLAVKAEEKQSHRENHSLYSNSGFLENYIHSHKLWTMALFIPLQIQLNCQHQQSDSIHKLILLHSLTLLWSSPWELSCFHTGGAGHIHLSWRAPSAPGEWILVSKDFHLAASAETWAWPGAALSGLILPLVYQGPCFLFSNIAKTPLCWHMQSQGALLHSLPEKF